MMYNAKPAGLLVVLSMLVASCVSLEEHEQLGREKQRVEAQNAALTQDLQRRGAEVTNLEARVGELTQDVSRRQGMLDQRGQELADARGRSTS